MRTRIVGAVAALAAFFVLAVSASSADTLEVRLVSQTSSTVTLGWDPRPGYGYLFSADGTLVSRTNDPARSTVKFSKGPSSYEVAVIVKGATGTYPPPPPPAAVCANGLDDDGDGKIDYAADPGCSSATDTDETDPVAPPPPPTGFPDATNTGVPPGTTLTPRSGGSFTYSTNNGVIDAISMTGCITVTGYGVTIKNSRIGCVVVDGGPANDFNNPPLTIQDTEIVCPIGAWNTGFRFDNTNLIRVNIHGCENGMDIGNKVTLRDSFIHDLAIGSTFHNDGIQGVPNNSTIEHNTIYGVDTSAIGFNSDAGANNVLIRNNLLAGGSYALYCPAGNHPTFQVVDNHFSTVFWPLSGKFGPTTDCAGEVLSGNVWHETGELLGGQQPAQPSQPPPPTTTQSCPLPAFPDASCTGVPSGVALTSSGGMTISTAGTVIDGRDITGQVVVNAPNVTIRRSRIRTNAMWAIDNRSTGLVVEDSEIINRPVSGQPNCHNAIGSANFTIRRSEITGCENGVDVSASGNVTVEDNYIHDLDTVGPSYVFGSNPHTDGIQASQSVNLVVRHNTIDPVGAVVGVGATSAIILYTGSGTPNSSNWIEDNYLDGRNASAALYAVRVPTHDMYVNRNRMRAGVYGLYTFCVKVGITVSSFDGNVDAATGAPISADNGVGGGCTN